MKTVKGVKCLIWHFRVDFFYIFLVFTLIGGETFVMIVILFSSFKKSIS